MGLFVGKHIPESKWNFFFSINVHVTTSEILCIYMSLNDDDDDDGERVEFVHVHKPL